MKKIVLIAAAFGAVSLLTVQADTIADWTFETSAPVITGTAAGPYNPEVGSGSATGLHAASAAYTSPAGDGSAKSFSANTWAVGDYYQFSVSTLGYNSITLSYDQTGSGTGPANFGLSYSTDGSTFTPFSSYTILVNSSPNPTWNATTHSSIYTLTDDLSSISTINNQSSVYFRIVDANTTSLAGGTVAGTGTDRVDNFAVLGTLLPVPEPGSVALAALGGLACLIARRRWS